METVTKILSILLSAIVALFSAFMTFIGNFTGEGPGTGTTATTIAGEAETGTTKPTTSRPQTSTDGKFVITAYGYGHGVGMSQEGAIVMAKSGASYVDILNHYYPGTKVYNDKSTPSKITYGSTSYGIVEFLCKTIQKEIGESAPEQAIKAQAATIYSFAKYNKFIVKTTQIAMNKNYSYSGTKLYSYVLSYLGMSSASDTPVAKFVSTDGKSAALTCFGASAAGKTTSAEDVWDKPYSYLVPVTTPEEVSRKAVTFTKDEMMDLIYNYNVNINLGKDPSTWITIISHDCSLSSEVGYVSKMTVGDKQMKGYTFRESVLKNKIRSHCFTISYEV